ncbi:type IV secretory system conjugative DNA transfer family protein [Nakamurella endophytica]|uniref:TraD/TraG TraM recognition site domain-containing protein n=1 Tax=Nakamurella endophytica TaxID=1748367 RepID=A0A917WN76_9ACTN|nr:TraM recognition domain-containing protein [Nakamurella endophytica]GGM15871.1 hypothetical protein GCM10011594_39890 [Nakamurella endophytica]
MRTDQHREGVTRISTSRETFARIRTGAAALAGAVLCVELGFGTVGVATGRGWHLVKPRWRGLFVGGGPLLDLAGQGRSTRRVQFPLTLVVPHVPLPAVAVVAAVLFAGWLLMLRRWGSHRRYPGAQRYRGLATVRQIRGKYGARAVRRTGRFTLPGTSWWRRLWLPTTSMGYRFGHPLQPNAPRESLWFGYETRLRIVARTGWGKSWRLLIPLIRQLPGAAVVSSVESEIFTATVKARGYRLPPVRYRWMRLLRRRWRIPVKYPVVVADLSDPSTRMAAGFPRVRWNPIVGCHDFKVATNRARALVHAGDGDNEFESSTDKFFRDSATQVLAAWLHAAALDPALDVDDIVDWLRSTDLGTPATALGGQTGDGYTAAKTAIMNMQVHLDPAAGRTTSGVRRYLNFAVSSLGSGQGRALCGSRDDPQFDMAALIAAGGTVYLLAEVDEMELARPLLTLFAQEMFLTAERTARLLPRRRLPQTFVGVFDELLAGVRVPILPYVASVQRKYGISFAYAVQSSADEEQLYGKAAAARLRTQCHSIIGGYDAEAADEITRRAGRAHVVTASRNRGRTSGGQRTEHAELVDVLPESDQQNLADGQSVVLGIGIPAFLATTHRADHRRHDDRVIHREMTQADEFVAARRSEQLANVDELAVYAGTATKGRTKP